MNEARARLLWQRASAAVRSERAKLAMAVSVTAVHDDLFPDLLRGIPVCCLLGDLGRLLDNAPILDEHAKGRSGLSARSASTTAAAAVYARSKACTSLCTFISHTWATPRWKKWLALITYFRARTAVLRVYAVAIVGCIAQLCGWVPPGLLGPRVVVSSSFTPALMSSVTFWCGGVVFVLTMLFGVRGAAESKKLCFLDKACIHQADEKRKKAGIESIGGFVARSEHMLALWTEDYFTRLWCIFELACHTAIVGSANAKKTFIVPVSHALIFAATQVISRFTIAPGLVKAWLAEILLDNSDAFAVATTMCGVAFNLGTAVCLLICVHAFRRRLRGVVSLRAQLQAFECQSASCFDPNDRLLILSCIELWFGSAEAFNAYVHHELAPQLLAQYGRLMPLMPGWGVLLICSTFCFEYLDALPYHLHQPAALADLFLQMVPGFLLLMSVANYGFSLLVIVMLWLERERGMPVWLSYTLGLCVGYTISLTALNLVPYPLYCVDSLPLSVRTAYVGLMLVWLWWDELSHLVHKCFWGSVYEDRPTKNGRISRMLAPNSAQETSLTLPCWVEVMLLTIGPFVAVLAVALLILSLLPVCPLPKQLHKHLTDCNVPCGISFVPGAGGYTVAPQD